MPAAQFEKFAWTLRPLFFLHFVLYVQKERNHPVTCLPVNHSRQSLFEVSTASPGFILVLFLISVTCASSHEPEVPPNAELSIEVELLEATDAPDLELLPPVERIALASLKREKGNVHYQRGDYAFAVNSYSIALQITESNSKGEMQSRDPSLNEGFVCHSVLGIKGVWEVGEHLRGRCLLDDVFLEMIVLLLNLKETLF